MTLEIITIDLNTGKQVYVSLAKLTTLGDTVGFRILLYETFVIMCRNIYYLPLSKCASGYRDIFKVIFSFVSRPENCNRTAPVTFSARPPPYTLGPYIWHVRSTYPTQFTSWVLNLHRQDLKKEFSLKINYWIRKSKLYTRAFFHLAIFWFRNTEFTSFLSWSEAQNNFSYYWQPTYEEVYRPEKLTACSTVQLVLNYSQADLDLFIKKCYVHQSAYILRNKSCVFLSYGG